MTREEQLEVRIATQLASLRLHLAAGRGESAAGVLVKARQTLGSMAPGEARDSAMRDYAELDAEHSRRFVAPTVAGIDARGSMWQ